MKKTYFFLLAFFCSIFLPSGVLGQTFLHAPHDAAHGLSCKSCHQYPLNGDTWPPDFPPDSPTDDDTLRNFICLRCHDGTVDYPDEIAAPIKFMHSSIAINGRYVDWTTQCVDCHDPHFQDQLQYRNQPADLYLVTGIIFDVNEDASDPQQVTTTISYGLESAETGWQSPDDWSQKTTSGRGLILFITDAESQPASREVLAADANSITVLGDSQGLAAGANFGLIYGQLIRSKVRTPAGVERPVRFFNPLGGFTDTESGQEPTGICQVCHTRTSNWLNDGTLVTHHNGEQCTMCHSPAGGFAHGGGSGDCRECHGKDAANGGYGTTQSHSTHTETDSDDVRGPGITCDACHDTSNFPSFKSGSDTNGDGRITLDEADVCNTCHSPGGTYDGVNDSVYGAKANWQGGIYNTDGSLKTGKEKWCAGCHDQVPSQINGVSAPNIVGDEDGSYTYGTGWGYYKTGHGLTATETYPASGGVSAGAGINCDGCHDLTTPHVDGLARTFDDGGSSSLDPAGYRQGYRLKQVASGLGSGASGKEPMLIPRPQNTGNNASQYGLCASCHTAAPAFLDANDLTATNLVTTANDGTKNRHAYHLERNNYTWTSDWNGDYNSRLTCVSCHNVHGSTRLAMVRDGSLIGASPGLKIWYKNDALTIVNTGNPDPPSPTDLPLAASDGTIWIGASSSNLCSHCHGSPNTLKEDRTPFQGVGQPPVLAWTGENGYGSDGASPDSGAAGHFQFRVTYTDANNDAPSPIELWLDANDNGVYEAGEKYAMSESDSGDLNYTDGKIFTKSLTVSQAGDNVLMYRFYASDGISDATGNPTSDSAIIVTNNPPVLAWTAEAYFTVDGVNPDNGSNGWNFEFRVTYTDTDNDAPSAIQIWVDEDDSGTYEPGEKYAMTVTGGDGDYANGEIFTGTLALAYAGDGILNYRFYASDGTADATGDPAAGNTVIVNTTANNPPFLGWATGGCISNGVRPGMGLATGDFEFMVTYTDPDNSAPSTIQVWVDEDDSGTYEPGEKYAMTVNGGDGDYANGEIFTGTLALAYAGDGILNYRFYASDGTDAAWGDPATDHTVTVVSTAQAWGVRPGSGDSGPHWYNSIQAAVNGSTDPATIMVYPNSDFTAATYNESVRLNSKHNRTIRSVCGADLTSIDGGTYSARFDWSDTGEIDGFSLTGATYGVYINGGSPVTIRNSRIHGNSTRGVHITNGSTELTITNCEIFSNGGSDSGAGLYLKGGPHTISDSIIRDNTTTSSGGGIRFDWTYSGTTITNTVIKGNTASGIGGGLYFNGGKADFSKCTITGNISSSAGGAMYLTASSSAASFENCIIADNRGTQGGVAYVNGGATSFINTTLADNQASSGNGGAFFLNCATTTVRNSIFWNNTASGSGDNAYKGCAGGNAGTVTDSDITTSAGYVDGGTFTTSNNIDPAGDPFFVGNGDYHIRGNSAVIDQANGAYAPVDDIDGDSRPQGIGFDMGADELH